MKKRLGRRTFLKGGAAIGGGAVLAGLAPWPMGARAASEVSDRGEGYALLTDLTRCIGCRRCEANCNRVMDLPAPTTRFDDFAVFAKKRRPDDRAYTVVNRYENPAWSTPVYRKVQCNHCAEPACVSACPVGALRKTSEGAVVYEENICLGCRYCMVACPFGIPAFEYGDAGSPAIQKCTMCYPRIAAGQAPACFEACPVQAIAFGKRRDVIKLARTRIADEPDRYVDHIYGEHEAGGTDWLYVSGVPFGELGFPTDVGSRPYPELTAGFLSAVPLVLVGWPALFGGVYAMTRRGEQGAETGRADPQDGRERSGRERSDGPGAAVMEANEEALAGLPEVDQRAGTSAGGAWIGLGRRLVTLARRHLTPVRRHLTPFNVIAGVLILAALALIATRFVEGVGAISAGSQDQPWGLLLGWGLFAGVPMSATGFILASAVHLFGLQRYRPVVRNAILIGLLGYFFAVIFLLIDLGRPWHLPYPMLVSFGTASVMFLIAWHVALYLLCQFLEFAPAACEWGRRRSLRALAVRATVGLTVFGVILSTLHQSALGALFLLAPGKVHPLWYSPYLPVLFLVSAIAAGICVVVVAGFLTQRFLRDRADSTYLASLDGITLGLGKAAAFVLITYFALHVIAVAHGDLWALLGTPYGYWFLFEVLGFVLLPSLLFVLFTRRGMVGFVQLTALLAVVGVVINRLNVTLIAFNWTLPERELLNGRELVVVLGVVALQLLAYRWIVDRMPVLREDLAYERA